jgi:hypothetical protein
MALKVNAQLYIVQVTGVSTLVLKETMNRVGLVICNANAAGGNTVFMSFGVVAQTGGFMPLDPREKRTCDYICPTDALYIDGTAGDAIIIEEIVSVPDLPIPAVGSTISKSQFFPSQPALMG